MTMKALPLPKSFDENEWFVIILLLVMGTLIIWTPKKFPPSITILLLLFPTTSARLIDKFLSAPDKDYYDVFDGPAFELFDLLAYSIYAPFGYFFIYIYTHFKFKGIKLVFYILVCSFLAIGFERMTHHFHLFKYKDFTLTQAYVFYVASQISTILFYHVIVILRNRSSVH
ncbi:hypothetical protein [Peribacillus alkalitolerans]|uniref:hypothetical protein n=1 Tax=Peribacillus alkalitolerans TaxID=1550385 RepID=UPI0013D85D77|nr:hypothetical protein [Peribacillus alkalitolerans]